METIDWLNELCISEINFANTYIAAPKIYPIKNKGRRHHGFIYTLEGTETYRFDRKKIVAVPDSLLYIPKNEQYTVTLEGEQSIVLVIDFELAVDTAHGPFYVKFTEKDSIKSFFYDAEKKWNRKNTNYPTDCKALFYKICAEIIKRSELYFTPKEYEKIADSVNHLHNHYLENDFRIEDLARIANISTRYYEKLFCRKFGTTPKEYILHLKLERAKELLHNEKILIRDIAYQLGYSDIYHFGKLFKAKTGYTPTEYRKEHL